MTVKRTFLNIGLLLLFITIVDAGLIFSGLSARYSYPPSFADGSLSEVLILSVISVVMIAIFSGAFKGYKSEFLKPYKHSVIATIIIQLLTILFSFCYLMHANTVSRRGDTMPGLNLLGDYSFVWIIWAIVILALIVIWVLTAIRHKD